MSAHVQVPRELLMQARTAARALGGMWQDGVACGAAHKLADQIDALLDAPVSAPPPAALSPLNLLDLELRQVTSFMESDVRKYGEHQCDYRSWIEDLARRRATLATQA